MILAIWESLGYFHFVSPSVLPTPTATYLAVEQIAMAGELVVDLYTTLFRTAIGLAISIPAGILIGLLIGWYKTLYKMLALVIFIFYSVPKLSLYAIILTLLGFTNQSVIALSVLGSIFPTLFASVAAVKSLDRQYVVVAKDNYAKDWQIFLRIIIPNSLPTIGAGIKLAVGIGFVETITAELFLAPGGQGLGYLLVTAGSFGQADLALGVVIITIILGGAVLLAADYFERRMSTWRARPA